MARPYILGTTQSGQKLIRDSRGTIRKTGVSQRNALVENIKIVEMRESTKGMEKLTYNPEEDTITGRVHFQVSPYIPEADLDANGELTRKSVYYGVILTEVLKFLNKNFRNFKDPAGNDFMNLGWEPSDIKSIQMASETFGYAEIQHPDASVNAMNLTLEAKLLRSQHKRLLAFRRKLAQKKVASLQREATILDVAEAFASKSQYEKASGAMSLMGGVVYSYGTPIALWGVEDDGTKVPYLDLSRYSSTTSTHQNALVRALSDHGIPYETTSQQGLKDMMTYSTPKRSVVGRPRRPVR
jgi:hypothetical protein